MHDLTHSYFRGFSNPADRTTWAWIAGAVIVAIVLTFLATAGRVDPRCCLRRAANPPQQLVPPIMQPVPRRRPTSRSGGL